MQANSLGDKYQQCSLLVYHYERYSIDRDVENFVHRVSKTYTLGSLERLATTGSPQARRAAVLCMGRQADYQANATLGLVLNDRDRVIRTLAENGLRRLWMRAGSPEQQRYLETIAEHLDRKRYDRALELATGLIEEAPEIAQAWYFRSRAFFQLEQYEASILDSQQALEVNAYHFSAASLMGQAYSRMECLVASLESYRLALRLNPNMEEARSQVKYLERTLMVK